MWYIALALDYDGTIAHHGVVDDETVAALEQVKKSGRRLLLVTGRHLPDLKNVFPRLDMFDLVVAENGALLYWPNTKETKPLGPPPPEPFLKTLRDKGVPVDVGHCIAATWTPHEGTVLDAIKQHGLELQIIFNKGAVMILPAAINKATGLRAAMNELGMSVHNVVGVGDAENDHSFLSACGFAAAVSNALDALKQRVDFVTKSDHGAGVREVVREMLDDDLDSFALGLTRHHIEIGSTESGEPLTVDPRSTLLIAGSSGSGKSTAATAYLEKVAEAGYQYCVVDPEGDYSSLEHAHAVVIGDPKSAPTVDEAVHLIEQSPSENVVVNLIGVRLDDRPAFFESFFARLAEMRTKRGRPHCILVDEAHHFLPETWRPTSEPEKKLEGIVFVTVHPEHTSPKVLAWTDHVIVIGKTPRDSIENAARMLGEPAPDVDSEPLQQGQALVWSRSASDARLVSLHAPRSERLRHRRKYAEGDLGADRSFYFRGAEAKLNLRANNLVLFAQLAEGIDDDTWTHHLQHGDYSKWFRDKIKDDELAAAAELVEARSKELSPAESRKKITEAIHDRYTLPA